MFDEQDRAYFARRAEQARAKAASATDAAVRQIHNAMAAEYDRRAAGEAPKVVRRF